MIGDHLWHDGHFQRRYDLMIPTVSGGVPRASRRLAVVRPGRRGAPWLRSGRRAGPRERR